jgi:uncharacterized protein YodC (DUF2158 family)
VAAARQSLTAGRRNTSSKFISKSKGKPNMSSFSRTASAVFALALGAGLGFSSVIVPASADQVSMQSGSVATLRTGDLVRVRSGGPLMTVKDVQGDNANCSWTDWLGGLNSQTFPIAVLQGPIMPAAEDPNVERVE